MRHLNGPSEVGLGKTQPEHAGNGHANTQPGEEAEKIDDREDVPRDGVHHGQQTLKKDKREDAVVLGLYSKRMNTHVVVVLLELFGKLFAE